MAIEQPFSVNELGQLLVTVTDPLHPGATKEVILGPVSSYALAKQEGFEGDLNTWLNTLRETPSGGTPGQFIVRGEDADQDILKWQTVNDATEEEHGFMSAEDKKRLDTVTLYKDQTPTTLDVGGVQPGYVPDEAGVEIVELIRQILHPHINPIINDISIDGADVVDGVVTVHAGTPLTINTVTVKLVTTSDTINSVEVSGNDGSVLGSDTTEIPFVKREEKSVEITLTSPLTITASKYSSQTLTVTVKDAKEGQSTSMIRIDCIPNIYYGAIADGSSLENADAILQVAAPVHSGEYVTTALTLTKQRAAFALPHFDEGSLVILDENDIDVTRTFTTHDETIEVGGDNLTAETHTVYVSQVLSTENFAFSIQFK